MSVTNEIRRSIWIGWDPREDDAYHVAHRSLRRHLSQPIPIHKLVLGDLQERGLYTRPTSRVGNRLIDTLSIRDDYDGSLSTEHANARFLAPHLAGSGWVLFMDGDMLVRADLAPLFDSLDPKFAAYCVKHAYWVGSAIKMDNQVQTNYPRKNWSSFIVWNCDHRANKNLTLPLINSLPGRDLHRLCWLDSDQIGELGSEWNWLVGHGDPSVYPAVVHFTDGLPDMPGYENVPFADEWRAERDRLKVLAA